MAKEPAALADLPFVRYVRVSRIGGREGDGYISKPEQVRKMDAKAREKGVSVYPEVLEDENRSGGNMDRPEFQRALALIRDGKAGGIIVATFDRFSRDEADTFRTIGEIEDIGGRLLCGDGDVSMATSHDAMQTGIRTVFNAFERRRKREGLADAVRNAVGRGVHLGVPFGYERSAGKGTPLAINEAEVPAVRMAFEMRAEGHSWQVIADAINATGIMPRPYTRDKVTKQAVWTYKTVRQIVVGRDGEGNRVYRGTAWNGQHATEEAHPAIVDADTYVSATQARGTKHAGPDEGHLLSGLVRCKTCGYVMTYNGRDFLRCRSAQHGDGRCSAPAGVNAHQLENLVLREFVTRYVEFAMQGHQSDDTVIEATAEARRAKMRHANLLAMMPEDMDGDEAENWRDQLKALSEALRTTKRREAEAKAQARGARLPDDLTADSLLAMIERGEIAEARTLLASVFAAVVVRPAARWREPVGERAHVIRRDDAPNNSLAMIAHVAAAA